MAGELETSLTMDKHERKDKEALLELMESDLSAEEKVDNAAMILKHQLQNDPDHVQNTTN